MKYLILILLIIISCSSATEPEKKGFAGIWNVIYKYDTDYLIPTSIITNKDGMNYSGIQFACKVSGDTYYCGLEVSEDITVHIYLELVNENKIEGTLEYFYSWSDYQDIRLISGVRIK